MRFLRYSLLQLQLAKVILFLLWGLCCCKIGWDSVMRMSSDDLVMGVNLWVFAQSSVNYARVFDLAQTHLSHREIWRCATWLTLIVPTSMTAYLYLYSHGEVSLAASQPVLLYAILLMILLSPFDMFYLSSRFYFLRTVWRIMLPLQAITFPDFFLG
ncbi:hypothetical protein GUJ93_ZPchr0820g22887 [Zizania palustris]|uniref:EXS domain-containing protein n=1 Tax=Zizania palustris TaxID=103762 RepID=A0A8J5VGQ4_ZIZPA|nr:hypothetical protein GUJ93_ZPchr0820g22887 [Zizania palustris]